VEKPIGASSTEDMVSDVSEYGTSVEYQSGSGYESGSGYSSEPSDTSGASQETSWWDQATQAVEEAYDQGVDAVEQAWDAASGDQAADDLHEDSHAADEIGTHIVVHLIEHDVMHALKVPGAMGPVSTMMLAYNAYCTFFAPCSTEERAELDRQYYEWYRECYPEIVAQGDGSTTRLWAAGCEADHGGASWSGPYRISREDAEAELNAHLAEWPDHEIVSGEGDVEPTDQGTFVAGCDADHNGVSWSGPERLDMNEAIVDLENHLADWPDHRVNSQTGQPGGSVRQVRGW